MIPFNSKIAIIGGGPAGLSLAMYLEEAGYSNYTIYEKSDHVGGKCSSFFYEGHYYELGALMGVPSYYAIKDIENFCGITHDGPKMSRIYKTLDGKVEDPFNTSSFFKKLLNQKTRQQVKKLGELLAGKYRGYDLNGHRGVSQGHFDGYAALPSRPYLKGDNPHLKDLALPFKEFCRLNHVPLVGRIWNAPFSAFGYGYFDEVPAAYVLKYLDFQTMMNFASTNLWTWEKGTQFIFTSLNQKLLHPACLNSLVSQVKRQDGGVSLLVNGLEQHFDYLMVMTPLEEMATYCDVSEKEKTLFSKIIHEDYDSEALLLKNNPPKSVFIMKNLEASRVGHLMTYYLRYPVEGSLVTSYALRSRKGQTLLSSQECSKIVEEDLVALKNPIAKVVEPKTWYYFPHVSSEEYAKGWYEQVEALQGTNRTFYGGEVLSFGDMDEVAEYSRELVLRFFGKKAS